jgi:hypothetical protein
MIFVDKRKTEHTAIWLLQAISQWGVLSDIYSKQAQFNTVFIRLIKMDRVGFEPTTSAMPRLTRAGKSNIIDTVQS